MSTKPKRLYDFPFSGNGYKVRLALAQLGLAVEYTVVDLLRGETASPAFLAKNPMGQIPVLELDDGTMLRESNAILFWLTDGTSLMPNDRLLRAHIVQWMCFEQSNIDKVLGRTRFLQRYPEFMPTTRADWEQWYTTGYRRSTSWKPSCVTGNFWSASTIRRRTFASTDTSIVPRMVDSTWSGTIPSVAGER